MEQPKKAVLVLKETEFVRMQPAAYMQAFRATLAGKKQDCVVYSESVRVRRLADPEYVEQLANTFKAKYAGGVDAIVTTGAASLSALLNIRDRLCPGVPVIFTGVTEAEMSAMKLPADVYGVVNDYPVRETLAAALDLCPGTKNLAIVSGAKSDFPEMETAHMEVAKGFADEKGLNWISLIGLTIEETKKRLATLPPDTIVGYYAIWEDASGEPFDPRAILTELNRVTNSPIFSATDMYLGVGVVGGCCQSSTKPAAQAAGIVAEVLGTGAKPPQVVRGKGCDPIFDWRELERWKLDESLLPPGSEVRYRAQTLWQQHRKMMTAIITVLVLQAALILGLLWQRRQRRLVEKSLKESEEHMAIATESADLGLWVWRIEDDRIWSTELFNGFYGYPYERILTGSDLFARIHPDDRETFRAACRDVSLAAPSSEAEYRVVMPGGGGERWLSSKGRANFGPDGRVSHLTGVTMNVTLRRRMEQDLQQHKDQLSHAMRVATMGELSASLAHELNQPLTSILWNAEAAQRLLGQEALDRDAVKECIEDILAEDKRASDVISSLKGLFKKDTGTPEPRDLKDLVTETLGLIRADLLTRRVSLALELPNAPLTVLADRVQIQQVLINLCVNAADAMVSTPEAEKVVTIRAEATGPEWVEVAVHDRGCGLDAEEIKKVFEPFHTSKASGLGMGLSICRTIVQAHGGVIWIESTKGKGATVRFTLSQVKRS